jgi:hypothetical protein
MRYLFKWKIENFLKKIKELWYNPNECYYITDEETSYLKDLYKKENIKYKIINI